MRGGLPDDAPGITKRGRAKPPTTLLLHLRLLGAQELDVRGDYLEAALLSTFRDPGFGAVVVVAAGGSGPSGPRHVVAREVLDSLRVSALLRRPRGRPAVATEPTVDGVVANESRAALPRRPRTWRSWR